MSGGRITVGDQDPAPELDAPVTDEEQADANASAPSIISTLAGKIAAAEATETITYPVGVAERPRLLCRYRAVDDDEAKALVKRANQEASLREKVGKKLSDIEVQNLTSALVLSAACEALVFVDDQGDEVDLHEYLARPEHGLEDPPTEPLRYTMESLEMLFPERVDRLVAKVRADDRQRPNSVDVVAEMHRWGEQENHASLRARGSDLQVWSSNVSARTLRNVLGG